MSLWLDGLERTYPPLEGDATADVAIVGGGIAGIASAYFLAKAGASVVVLEARGVAEAASGRNAGFLLAGVAENFAAATRRYGAANALRIWRLTKRTQALVRVELPLALPAIIAGLRIAVVTTIALATIVYTIYDAGLGVPIHVALGEGPFKTELICAAALTIGLAIACDGLLVLTQRALTPWLRARSQGG